MGPPTLRFLPAFGTHRTRTYDHCHTGKSFPYMQVIPWNKTMDNDVRALFLFLYLWVHFLVVIQREEFGVSEDDTQVRPWVVGILNEQGCNKLLWSHGHALGVFPVFALPVNFTQAFLNRVKVVTIGVVVDRHVNYGGSVYLWWWVGDNGNRFTSMFWIGNNVLVWCLLKL